MPGAAGDQLLAFETAGAGDGMPLVFIHPNGLDRTCWMYQVAWFSRDHMCISIDLPGYGGSAAVQADSVDRVAQLAWQTVERLVADQPVLLVGCSLGSHVVQHMFHQRPQTVVGLAVSGTGVYDSREFAQRRAASYRREGVSYISAHARELFSPQNRSSAWAEWLVSLSAFRNSNANVGTIARIFESRVEDESLDFYSSLDVPMSIIAGVHDAGQPQASERLAVLAPRSSLAVIQDAGHVTFLESPEVFNRELSALIDRCS